MQPISCARLAALFLLALAVHAAPAFAQDTATAPDQAGVTMPALDFAPTPEIEAEYEKYFYFHRVDTTFGEAYADIKECDALASGANFYGGGNEAAIAGATAQYGALAAGVGGAIGSAMADAIFGSAQRRKMHRINVRNCMNFKDYKRYGLSRDRWTEFNFEEGLGRKKEDVRETALRQQALVASGTAPNTKALEP
jgi:hypothetical protein